MSYIVQDWARGVKTGSQSRKAVLMALANYANKDGICWPSQARIANDTDMSERSVRRALTNLQSMGIIDRQHRRDDKRSYKTDLIRLIIPAPAVPESVSTRCAGAAMPSGQVVQRPAANLTQATGQSDNRRRSNWPPNLSKENRSVEPLDSPSNSPSGCSSPTGDDSTTERVLGSVCRRRQYGRRSLDHSEHPTKPARERTPRATRLPANWTRSDDDFRFARREGLSLGQIEREEAKFKDYWTAKSGQDATKNDWPATWRNWVRRAADAKAKAVKTMAI